MAINSVGSTPVANVNNGNLEKATQGDKIQEHTTAGAGAVGESGGASKPNSGGNINVFGDPAKTLPIGDDLFE